MRFVVVHVVQVDDSALFIVIKCSIAVKVFERVSVAFDVEANVRVGDGRL